MNTVERIKHALWQKSGLPHDHNGYVEDVQLNFINGVGVIPEAIKNDYCDGSGHEWLSKIRAIHSSAALVVNTFGHWKTKPAELELIGLSNFKSLKFEAQCRTGLRGTPPHLDMLLQSSDTVIGIESKLLEPLTTTIPHFTPSYSRDKLPQCENPWWNLLKQVRQWPPSYLDAAQLIKHYLGLMKQFSDKNIYLIYLYWKPLNYANISEYDQHAKEIEKFYVLANKSRTVKFITMDYLQLWDLWEKDVNMAGYARLLKERYCVKI